MTGGAEATGGAGGAAGGGGGGPPNGLEMASPALSGGGPDAEAAAAEAMQAPAGE